MSHKETRQRWLTPIDQHKSRLSLLGTAGVAVLESASTDKCDFYDLGIKYESDHLGAGKTCGVFGSP